MLGERAIRAWDSSVEPARELAECRVWASLERCAGGTGQRLRVQGVRLLAWCKAASVVAAVGVKRERERRKHRYFSVLLPRRGRVWPSQVPPMEDGGGEQAHLPCRAAGQVVSR